MKFLLLLLTLSIYLSAHVKHTTLVLPWKHQFQFAGYYMAKEKGFYKQVGLDVKLIEYTHLNNNILDVASGKYNFGVGHSSLILEKINTYDNIILLNAIHQSSPFVLLSTKYKDIKDITGKSIMMNKDQTATASINALLNSSNLQENSFKSIKTSFNPLDLLNNNADFMASYISNEPYTLAKKGIKYYIIDPKEHGYNFYSDILFTSKQMIKNNKEEVDNFRLASLKGWEYAYEHIDETVDVILKHYNTQGKTKDSLIYEANKLKNLAFEKDTKFGDINPLRLKEIATVYNMLGLIEAKKEQEIDFQSFIYSSSKDFNFIINKQEDINAISFFKSDYFFFTLVILGFLILLFIYYKIKTSIHIQEQNKEINLKNSLVDKNIPMSTTDIYGRITYVSEAFCKLSGYSALELISSTHAKLKDNETSNEIYKDLWLTISSGHTWRGELKNKNKNAAPYWINAIISPIFDSQENILGYEAVGQDITLQKVLKQFNKKLEEEVRIKTEELLILATTDKLTGIYNRVKIDDLLTDNLSYFQNFHENFSFIIIDIDLFKNVNDNYGHQIGDIILQEVVQTINQNIRSSDTLGRWGGEEFVVICPKSDRSVAFKVAQKIRKAVESYTFSRVGQVTISAGVSDMVSSNNIEKLISIADNALYKAKESGRNRVEG